MQISSELSTFSILLIGFVLGLRHATEADHLAAVSTIVSEKKSLFTASVVCGLLIVGMVHGLAGSAALMLLVVPTIYSPLLAMTYIVVFGIGSIGGMMVMSLLIGLPFHFTANRFDLVNKGIRLCSGVFSCGLGFFI